MSRKRSPRRHAPSQQPFQPSREWLLEVAQNIARSTHRVDRRLANRGASYFGRIGEFHWEPEELKLSCQVKGSLPQPYLVTLRFDEDGEHDSSCTCPYANGYGMCKHVFAVLRQVFRRLTAPRDEFQDLLLSGGARPSAPWSRIVGDLDRFLVQRERQAAVEPEEQETRLVWRIDVQDRLYGGRCLSLAPFEQKLTKKKTQWSKGRRLDWERLAQADRDELNEQDRRVVEAVRRNRNTFLYMSYGQASDPTAIEALSLLIGHPYVFWGDESDTPLEIRRGQFGAALVEQVSGWQISPVIDGEPAGNYLFVSKQSDRVHGAVAVFPERNQIRVAPAEQSIINLVLSLRDRVHDLPADGREQILERLARLQAYLPVTLPPSLLGGEREADGRIFLRLIPQLPCGLTADARVRPTANGAVFEPGAGPAELANVEEGKPILVKRDLERELAQARALVEKLGLPGKQQLSAWKWKINHDEDALDLIGAAGELESQGLALEWLEGAKMWVSREITPQALRVEIQDHKDWFGLKGTIDLDGEQIPLADLLANLRGEGRYISLGENRWLRIADAFRRRLSELEDVVHRGRSGLEIDLSAAPVVEEFLDESSIELKACKAWREALARLEAAQDLDPSPPITLAAELRDYQIEGYRWLRRLAAWGVGGCLADDMGLGKTVQTLAVLLDRMEEGPALVVAPTSVGFNWVRETERFAPTLRPHLYRETDRNDFLATLGEGDLVVISYGLLLRDAEKLAQVEWGTLVLDEAQKIKNSQTKTAQQVRQLSAKWRLALTGTPLENHLGELWSIFRGVCPGLLGSWDRFRTRFAEPIERDKDPARRKALSRVVRPFILRRTKAEVLEELPPRTEIRRTAELSPAERKRYEEARFEAVARLSGLAESETEDHRFQVLAALTRLRQLACHPKLVDDAWPHGSAKLELLLEIVDELRESKHRALVFSQFTSHLALIRQALDERGIRYQYLDGQTPARRREELVDAFQRGEGDLFLISLKAGGTGLNLTAADYVIHMDPWWNPAVEDQATDRAHRIGQTRPVTVYRLVTQDTIEEQILALHAEKRHLVSDILEGTGESGKLSTKELISLMRAGVEEQPANRSPRPSTGKIPRAPLAARR